MAENEKTVHIMPKKPIEAEVRPGHFDDGENHYSINLGCQVGVSSADWHEVTSTETQRAELDRNLLHCIDHFANDVEGGERMRWASNEDLKVILEFIDQAIAAKGGEGRRMRGKIIADAGYARRNPEGTSLTEESRAALAAALGEAGAAMSNPITPEEIRTALEGTTPDGVEVFAIPVETIWGPGAEIEMSDADRALIDAAPELLARAADRIEQLEAIVTERSSPHSVRLARR